MQLKNTYRRRGIVCQIDKLHLVGLTPAALSVEYTAEYELIVANGADTQLN